MTVAETEPPGWIPWTFQHVVDVSYPAFAARTYLEHADVRAYLTRASTRRPIARACEVGCGYGRMTVVLGEFATDVAGFERQPEFVDEARRLHPRITFHGVASLDRLPASDASFDFAMTFTVLQHLTDAAARRTIAEIKRIVDPAGSILICEETDTTQVAGEIENDLGMCTIGRRVETYAEWLAPFRLAATSPRRIEPTYPRPDVGTYMLFQP
jgi:SAM-dependent methyltransferase